MRQAEQNNNDLLLESVNPHTTATNQLEIVHCANSSIVCPQCFWASGYAKYHGYLTSMIWTTCEYLSRTAWDLVLHLSGHSLSSDSLMDKRSVQSWGLQNTANSREAGPSTIVRWVEDGTISTTFTCINNILYTTSRCYLRIVKKLLKRVIDNLWNSSHYDEQVSTS